eukprot:10474772-Alexandrium_andersonii.AAC.1
MSRAAACGLWRSAAPTGLDGTADCKFGRLAAHRSQPKRPAGVAYAVVAVRLSLIHISEPTRLALI